MQMFSCSHSLLWHYMGVSSQLHSPAAYPKDRAPGTHLIEGWVRPRGSLIFEEQKKSLALNRNVNLDHTSSLFRVQNEQGSLYTAINSLWSVPKAVSVWLSEFTLQTYQQHNIALQVRVCIHAHTNPTLTFVNTHKH